MAGRLRLAPMSVLTVLLVLLAAACAGGAGSVESTSSGGGGQAASTPTTPTTDAAPPTGPRDYTTTRFAVPMTVTVDSWLKTSAPEMESSTLMYWSPTVGDNKVRFLLPAIVYPSSHETATDPPADFVGYLHSNIGFQIRDEGMATVGGRPATLMTVTTDTSRPEASYSGALGCASRDASKHDIDKCFTAGVDYQLRLAVIDLGGRTLLGWARADRNSPDAPELHRHFEALLASIRFR